MKNTMLKFELPKYYYWLLERNLITYEPFGPLQPWFYLPRGDQFLLNQRWHKKIEKLAKLAFAKRQDNDELACFVFNLKGEVNHLELVQGWTEDEYTILKVFNSFLDWLKYVLEDIALWIEVDDS